MFSMRAIYKLYRKDSITGTHIVAEPKKSSRSCFKFDREKADRSAPALADETFKHRTGQPYREGKGSVGLFTSLSVLLKKDTIKTTNPDPNDTYLSRSLRIA